MAGRARTKALEAAMEKRAIETLAQDDDHLPTTLDYVCDQVESGVTLKELALSLTSELGDEVTYARVMAVLRATHGEAAVDERLDASRKRASHCLAETAIELVDQEADSNVDVSRAASRARTRQWLAEKWNRQQYGQQRDVSVSVTVGSLHLDALRAPTVIQASVIAPASRPALSAPAEDAQVIDAQHVSDS